jgi:uncharacterized membrane protein
LSETRQIALVIVSVLVIGILGLLVTGGLPGVEAGLPSSSVIAGKDVYVDDYSADLYLNGTLKESFIYNIDAAGKYRMLYRTWTTLPVYIENPGRPYVEPLQIIPPSRSIPYIKDQLGNVTITSEDEAFQAAASEISSLAEPNEVGSYRPQRFDAGRYRIDYLFSIHPPLECDSEYCHWNLAFADKHLPYRQATITIHDPENLIVRLFPHTSMPFDVKKEGDAWVITGSSPEDGLIEVEMLLRPEASKAIDGFKRQVSDVEEKTLSAQSESASWPLQALRTLVLIFPFALAIFYYRFGKEKQFTVSEVLSYVPQKRKPWLVNMVFRGDAFDFDENGFYATLLDLHERGAIEIDSKNGLKIKLLKGISSAEEDYDDYERSVLSFLKENSVGGIFDPSAFEGKVKALSSSLIHSQELKDLHDRMNDLLHKGGDKNAACAFVSGRSIRMLGGFGLNYVLKAAFYLAFFIIFFGGLSLLSNPLVATGLILIVQIAIVIAAPSALFGRWKEDYYKEKLEWDAFRNFLSDFAMIKKYAPEDLEIWREWLIYGTALGVGDKVRDAMASLNVIIPLAIAERGMRTHFAHAYATSAPKSSGSGSGGGGGGFGGGGGSGGGGGGAR